MNAIDRILARDLAPVLRRNALWCIWTSVAVVLLVIVFLCLRWYFNWPKHGWMRVLPLLGGLLPSCIILPIGWVMRRSVHREWLESGGRLCAHCGYNVSALAAAGICPECGQTYDIEKDGAMWAKSGMPRGHGQAPHSAR